MTAQKLLRLWMARDQLYVNRRVHGEVLTDREVRAIRMGRMLEVDRLPEKERAAALAELAQWTPPFGLPL